MPKHQLPALLLLLAVSSCDETPDVLPLADSPPPALRNVMFELDALNWTVEPVLRDRSQAQPIASAARSMQRWATDPAWEAYFDEPSFLGDRGLFSTYLGWLRTGLEQLASAAETTTETGQGDLEGMRAGFIRVQQSCVACHKRFQPNK